MALTPGNTRRDLVKAALTIAAGLAVLGLFIVFLGGYRFWERLDSYVIRFDTVKDLGPGRRVKYAGLDIGRVLAIGLDPADPKRVSVTIGVYEGFPLFAGTRASISQKGLVGDNYVLLELVGPPGERLRSGAEIPPQATANIQDVAQKLGGAADELLPQVMALTVSLRALLSPENVDGVSRAVQALPATLDEARLTLAETRAAVAGISGRADQGLAAFAEFSRTASREVSRSAGSVEAVSRDASRSLAAASQNLDRVSADLSATLRQAGQLGTDLSRDLAYDQQRLLEVLGSLDTLSRELTLLGRSLRERPWQLVSQPKEDSRP